VADESGWSMREKVAAAATRKFSHPLPLFQELPWCTSRGSVAAMLPELPPPTPFLPLNIPPPSHLVLPGPLCKCEPTRPSRLVDPPYTSPLFYPFGSPGSPPPPANCLQLAAPKSKSAGAVHSEQKTLRSARSIVLRERKDAVGVGAGERTVKGPFCSYELS